MEWRRFIKITSFGSVSSWQFKGASPTRAGNTCHCQLAIKESMVNNNPVHRDGYFLGVAAV